ncbi:MAG: energy-coupling factor ABC transporter ATP-binding protein [Halanaerobiales bacterium]
MDKYAIEFKNVSFNYNYKEKILDNVSIKILKREIIGIMGESGQGKSTILKLINGLIPKRISGVKTGGIFINGKNNDTLPLPVISTIVGSVFQNPDDQIVFPEVEDELAFGPENLCLDKEVILRRIEEVLSDLEISHLRHRNPNNLSGGEKQLVNIAAIMTMGADIILLDESLSFLDENGKDKVLNTLQSLRNQGKTIIMVDHDYKNLKIADRILLLESKDLCEVNNYGKI